MDREAGDWAKAVADCQAEETAAMAAEPQFADPIARWFCPQRALAYAMSGSQDAARALIERTPLDCYICVRTRGAIASAQHDWAAADRWFAEAVRQAPSIPLAYLDWGRSLLERGQTDAAIAKLALAHQKGPHHADASELWGEALMRKGDFAGAAARFAEADANAPHWGRNHLMWGQALMLSRRYRQARTQYETADALDLNRPDRAALAVLLARTAMGPLHG
jgi:tetratricopeptide (TPR) repeat protein